MALSFDDVFHAAGLAIVAMASAGCETRTCTEIGCTNSLGVELRTATGAWTDGVYELAVRADDRVVGACSFRLPEQLPDPPGQSAGFPCGENIRFVISYEAKCEMGCDGNACWQTCTPIPGKFESRLSVTGTPARFAFTLVRDGHTILAEDIQPAYRDVYPNGPECGGACRQATLEYAVP
jgi:hypothetical protein